MVLRMDAISKNGTQSSKAQSPKPKSQIANQKPQTTNYKAKCKKHKHWDFQTKPPNFSAPKGEMDTLRERCHLRLSEFVN